MNYTTEQTQPEIEIATAVSLVVSRLLSIAATDSQLAGGLRNFARQLSTAIGDDTNQPAAVVDEAPAGSLSVVLAEEPSDVATLADSEPFDSRPVLSFPNAPTSRNDAADYSDYEQAEIDLSLVEQRARLKSQGCSWRSKRPELIANGSGIIGDIDSEGRGLIEQAKALPDCLLWMLRRSCSASFNAAEWTDLAGCFTTMADAVALVRRLVEDADEDVGMLDEGLQLLAEAQSAVRWGVDGVGLGQDRDQHQAYFWLRNAAEGLRKYIKRFMRIDDPADPTLWSDLSLRIEKLKSRFDNGKQQAGRRKAGIGRVKYHASRIACGSDKQVEWRAIIDAVTELIQNGLPASNPELRHLLVPIVHELPDLECSKEFRLVVNDIDRYLASRAEGEHDNFDIATKQELATVARLLSGRAVVLIGGNPRPKAHAALKSALGVERLDWIDTVRHDSVTTFEPNIARPDVMVVVLAIRWASHSYGEVTRFCEKYGKLLVRLPAGYNANQVAYQIKNQCGDRLAAAKAAEIG